jgi:hypothetical protein
LSKLFLEKTSAIYVFTQPVSITAGGAISDSGVLAVTGTSSFTTDVDDIAITLDQASTFTGAMTLTTQSAGGNTANVSITNLAADMTLAASTVAGDLTISGASITVSGALAGSGAITLDANGTNADVNINAALTAGAGSAVTITADDSVFADANGDITASGAGALSVTSNTNNSNGDSGNGITMADGTLWDAGSGTISITFNGTGSGNFTIGGLTTTNATATALTITSDLSGLIDAGDTHVELVAASGRLVLDVGGVAVATGGGADQDIETTVDSIDLDNTAANVRIDETDAITIIKLNQTASSGTLSLDAVGTITVSGAVTFNAGGTTLTATGQNSDILVNAAISNSGSGGGLNLNAADSIIFGGAGDITIDIVANNLNITANTDNLAGDSGNVITMDNGTLISATAGSINLINTGANGGNITLGGVTNSTGNVAINTAAAIIDGGDMFVDVITTSGTLVINAVSGIGSAGAL